MLGAPLIMFGVFIVAIVVGGDWRVAALRMLLGDDGNVLTIGHMVIVVFGG